MKGKKKEEQSFKKTIPQSIQSSQKKNESVKSIKNVFQGQEVEIIDSKAASIFSRKKNKVPKEKDKKSNFQSLNNSESKGNSVKLKNIGYSTKKRIARHLSRLFIAK